MMYRNTIPLAKKALFKVAEIVHELLLSIHLLSIQSSTDNVDSIIIVLRDSCLDSTTLSLLKQFDQNYSGRKIWLGVNSGTTYSRTARQIQKRIDEMEIEVSSIPIKSRKFNRQLARSDLLFYTSNDDIWLRRAVSKSDLTIIHLYHGINLKARGNLSAPNIRRQRRKRFKRLPVFEYGWSGIFDTVDIKSVASDPELFYHAAGAARAPGVFRKYGYPQIDRSRELAEKDASPILAESLKEQLRGDNQDTILFAPTGDSENPLEILTPEITDFLEQNDAELYLRMHITKEQRETELVTHDRIHHISRDQAPSSVELLPYIDILVTDFSSIFIEYLPFNRPIVFDKTAYDMYQKQVGISYEYDQYFPGETAADYTELERKLEQCLEGSDGHSSDRQFVSKVLLAYEDTFITNLKSDDVVD